MFKKIANRYPFACPFCLAGIWIFFFGLFSAPINGQSLTDYFQPLPPTDTLHVEICLDTDCIGPVDTIPNRLFFSEMPPAFLQEIEYMADSSMAVVLGRYHFPLNDSIEVYWVEIRQFWFHNHSLLLYDKHKKSFVAFAKVAGLYGGEADQVLVGSWIFDYDNDGQKDIIRREIWHGLTLKDDTAVEHIEESAFLLRWVNGHFTETFFTNFEEMAKRFPIKSIW